MKYFIILGICSLFLMYSFSNNKIDNTMGIQVKDKVKSFAKAIENRDVEELDQLLHKDFRVIANQFPTEDQLSLMSKDVYLSMIKSGKIGGTKYDVIFDYISVEDHSTTVITKFQGEKSDMYLTLLLIETDGDWKIIEDMALVKQ